MSTSTWVVVEVMGSRRYFTSRESAEAAFPRCYVGLWEDCVSPHMRAEGAEAWVEVISTEPAPQDPQTRAAIGRAYLAHMADGTTRRLYSTWDWPARAAGELMERK